MHTYLAYLESQLSLLAQVKQIHFYACTEGVVNGLLELGVWRQLIEMLGYSTGLT